MDAEDKMVPMLLTWYGENARELPWRQVKNPYYIWISEIMLQQTRVEAVKPYYARFLETFPTIGSLAAAEEEVLLKLWEGLGYYSRVRNLQKAARTIMTEFGGEMPQEYKDLLKLSGIGPYTAGAIASIAFSKPQAAVDGNVLRVMTRLTADTDDITLDATKKKWETELITMLPRGRSGEFNQALMELGAMVCLPNGAPKCNTCPLRQVCKAYSKNQVMQFPVKSPKKERTKEYLSVFFIVEGEKIAIGKRGKQGLLKGLWQLPNCPRETSIPRMLQEWGVFAGEISPMRGQKHIFTHIEWHMDCYFVVAKEQRDTIFQWVTREQAEKMFALPSAFRKQWEEGCKRIGE